MKEKKKVNPLLVFFAVIFALAITINLLGKGFTWLSELISLSRPQISATTEAEDPFTNVTAKYGRWLMNPVPIKPGYHNKVRTAPIGKPLLVMIRDENLDEFDRFSLGDENGTTGPKKQLLRGKQYFYDFQSTEIEEVEVIVWRIPL